MIEPATGRVVTGFPVYAVGAGAVADGLSTDAEDGLAASEAAARLQRYGRNRLEPQTRTPYARLVAHQLVDPLVALLVAAAIVSAAIGDPVDGIVIAAIVILNAVLGFMQELSAARAINALARSVTHVAVVVRDGREASIDAEEVVPGDVVVVGEGDRVAADVRLTEVASLEVDESALTGESLPVAKQVEPIAEATPLAERSCMLYAGTGVTRGRGRGLVCATGAETELGQIGMLAAAGAPPPTPLAVRLGLLARRMVIAGVCITLALAGVMLVRGEPLREAFLTGVAAAVAAVPEALSATVTIALALGAAAMARRGAILRRLAAIETLGETTVICTDKTGTLTQNRIEVAELMPAPGFDEGTLLAAAARASAARRVGGDVVGDPVETALVRALGPDGEPDGMLVHEVPFDSVRKRMTRVWDEGGRRRAYTKGAPEVVVAHAGGATDSLLRAAAEQAGRGLRVLAVATRPLDGDDDLDDRVEDGATLVGIVALRDPLRPSSAAAVQAARDAGIEVRMVTGDHPATARTIGRELGLGDEAILARATPRDKLELVERLQREGHVVAVTGDGVNDAPALRRADVGVAMGRSGTEAAREASALVLTDDDFATIVAAVAEGRRIGDNIRKFVAFLLSGNLGEVIAFAVAITAGLGAPLAVVQILIINLVTDGLPAVALARDTGTPSAMRLPPRTGGEVIGRRLWALLLLVGPAVGAVTLVSFGIGEALGGGISQTMAFTTLALSELALALAYRSAVDPAWRLPPNRWLLWSIVLSLAVVGAAVYLPAAHDPLSTVALSAPEVLVAVALAAVPATVLEAAKRLRPPGRPNTSHETSSRLGRPAVAVVERGHARG
jgi:Ca2+-transporting ATPase